MKRLLRITPAPLLLALALCCSAVSAEELFYRQLIDLKQIAGYAPTRTFTVIVDGEHGNRLTASDDVDLQFNLMWIDQFQPDYRSREGGAALGQLFRAYARQLYDSYRGQNSQGFGYLPDGDVDVSGLGEMDYHLRVSGDEVKLRFEYLY